MSDESHLDAVLQRISPDKRASFLRAQMRVKQFNENDEVLALANYLDNFAVLIDGLTQNLPGTNGTQPDGKMTPAQYHAITELIKALPSRQDLAALGELSKNGGGDKPNSEMQAFLQDWRTAKSQKRKRIAVLSILSAVVAVAIAFGAGWMLCWKDVHLAADARVDRVIDAQPSNLRALLLLQSHRGSLTVERVNDGKGDGIVMRRGDLPPPWLATDGSAAALSLP
jgi:hypothetical protein